MVSVPMTSANDDHQDNHFDIIPEDVLSRILDFVMSDTSKAHTTLSALACTCQRFYQLCSGDSLWQQLYLDMFPRCRRDAVSDGWRQRYREKLTLEYNWATENFECIQFSGHRGE